MAFFHRNRMCLVAQSCPTLCDPMDCSPPVLGGSSGKNTRVGFHPLLQGIFPTQKSNPNFLRLLHCMWILYPLSYLESPTNRINYPEICMDSQNLCGFSQVAKAVLRKDKMLQALHSMISVIWCRYSNRNGIGKK